jgi:mono/diheme cytochrome c family protein
VAIQVGLVGLASGLVYAQYDRGYYSEGNGGAIRRFAILLEMDGAVYSVGVYPMYPPELAAGEGREAVQSYCSTCHSTRYITMQPVLPPDAWTAEVNKMVNVMGAGIPEDVQPVIIKYLQAHCTPETRKR